MIPKIFVIDEIHKRRINYYLNNHQLMEAKEILNVIPLLNDSFSLMEKDELQEIIDKATLELNMKILEENDRS